MSKTTFRILIIVDVLLVVIAATTDHFLRGQLPEALQEYLSAQEDAEFENNPALWILIFGSLSVAAVGIAAWIGLLIFWRPARLLYTIAFVLSWPLYALVGPNVTTGPAHMLYDMSSVLAGVIWALLYFSPLKVHFERPTEPLAP